MRVLPIIDSAAMRPMPFEYQGACSCENRRWKQMRGKIFDQLLDDPFELFWHRARNPLLRRKGHSSEGTLHKKTSQEDENHIKKNANFFIRVNFSDFKPEEISVNVKGRKLMLLAKHEDKILCSEVRRQFTIPAHVDPETIVAMLDQDGMLSIRATSNVPEVAKQVECDEKKTVSQETCTKSSCAEDHNTENNSSDHPEQITVSFQQVQETPEIQDELGLNVEGSSEKETSVKDAKLSANECKEFCTSMEVSGFKPEEITVKIKNGKISVHAKHEENKSGLFVFEELRREFSIPHGVDPETLVAEMNKDASLNIKTVESIPEKNRTEKDVPCSKETSEDEEGRILDIEIATVL